MMQTSEYQAAAPSAPGASRSKPPLPRGRQINGRYYWRRSEIDHWKKRLEAFALGLPEPAPEPPPPGDPLLPKKRVAAEFGVCGKTIERWAEAG
jgi:hypothetical protein